MRRHSGYLVGCGGAVFAIATFLVGLEVSSTTAAPSIARTAPMVNRTLKSDRMPLASTKSRNAVNGPAEITVPPPPPAKARLPGGGGAGGGRKGPRAVGAGPRPLRVLSLPPVPPPPTLLLFRGVRRAVAQAPQAGA